MFCIKIAEIVIGIDNHYPYLERLCRDFRVEGVPELTVSVTEEEIAHENIGEGDFSAGYCEGLAIYRKICRALLAYDAFLMHAAVIAIDGKAYAFTARSGTGKTTHIRLWLQQYGKRVEVVNGDKPILRVHKGEVLACGTPWRGKENLGTNICRPLRGLCFVERGAENQIRRLTQKEVVGRVFHQLLLPEDEDSFDRYMDLIEQMLTTVPCYLLSCTPELEAATIAYKGMIEGKC